VIPPTTFAGTLFRHYAAAVVEVERRVAELRALTNLDQASAIQWMTVLAGIQATSRTGTPDTAWELFRRGIMEGATPVAAAAHVVEHFARRDGRA